MSRILDPYKNSLRLVVLSACYGSNPGQPGHMFGGVAHDLHRMGLQHVIASQLPLSREGSALMAAALYGTLFQGDASVSTAFKAAQDAVTTTFRDWASLQLFCFSHELPESRRRALRRSRRVLFSKERTLPELVSGDLAVAHEVNLRIPTTPVLKALAGTVQQEPDIAVLNPLGHVEDALPVTPKEWKKAFAETGQFVQSLMEKETLKRQPVLHLFGCAPLPLMFYLGWRLDRHPLRVYQQQRGRGDTWTCGYDSNQPISGEERFLRTDSWPTADAIHKAGGRVAVTVEVSRRIEETTLSRWLGKRLRPTQVRLLPPGEPSHTAVRTSADAAQAVLDLQKCLDRIHDTLPDVKEVWLALVCPASLAAALGRAFNPKAQAPLRLFNFRTTEGYVDVYFMPGGARARRPRQ
ncbi:hypothetical protein BON30_46110 [Cystobacter ferrugineus]|uniref:SMODS-associated and fused to various effectors domain-containing protein n=1 Tax=Cystobacter ferrugineus TaxID=83449 RepID=A0A1L9AVB4_9BACT|nr:hypothetical protein BON30_46110 [Cystobacter ferrugineus]